MADRHHGEPNTLWPSDYCSTNCTCIIKRVLTCFEVQDLLVVIASGCDKWPLWIKLFSDTRWIRETLLHKECEVTPNWTKHTIHACYLGIKYFHADIVVWFVVVAWFTQKTNPDNWQAPWQESPETNLVDIRNFSFRNLGPLLSQHSQFWTSKLLNK